MKPRVVIVGGGFGGVYTLRQLLKKCDVTLISPENYFLFTPMLHEYLAGTVSPCSVIFPFEKLFNKKKFHFVKGIATSINFHDKAVHVHDALYPYDYLVIAIGAHTNHHGVAGAEEYTIGLKTIHDADRFLELFKKKFSEKKSSLTVSVIGGGPTGIELATEFAGYMKRAHRQGMKYVINLIHSHDIFLPEQGDYFSKEIERVLKELGVTIYYHSRVARVTEGKIHLDNKSIIPSDLIFFTGGVAPNIIKTEPHVTDKEHYFLVNEHLQLIDYPSVFVLGDCARVSYDKGKAPALAQVAVKEASLVAKNILLPIKNKPLKKFHLRLDGFLLSLGQKRAVGHIHGLKFKGLFAWFIWRTVYLLKMIGVRSRLHVMWDWTKNVFRF